MKVLIACEESQEVCKAFRERGHEAFSCDLQDCSGGHPEWHVKGDVLPLLRGGIVPDGGRRGTQRAGTLGHRDRAPALHVSFERYNAASFTADEHRAACC